MTISKLKIKNCFCFRGEHEIDLDAKVYAITARYEGEESRSNWGGKSSLMKLLGPHPLFGWHDLDKEDDWITDGEDEAYCELELDNGDCIVRSRQRGKSTQARVFSGTRQVGQKGADAEIVRIVGHTDEEFFASRFFRQKSVDRLITLRPAERQELVMGWLNLLPLKKCETDTREELSECLKKISEVEAQVKLLETEWETYLGPHFKSLSEIEQAFADCTAKFETVRLKAEAANADVTRVAGLQMAHAQRDADCEYLVQLKESLAALLEKKVEPVPDISSLENSKITASLESKILQDTVKRLKVLAKGEFDGQCPLVEGLSCPAKAFINEDRGKHAKALENASTGLLEASKSISAFEAKIAHAKRLDAAARCHHNEIDALQKKIQLLEKKVTVTLEPLPATNPSDLASDLNREVGNLQFRGMELRRSIKELERIWPELDGARKTLAKLNEKRMRLAESVAIFKAAQTKCAEEGLAEITEGANDVLADAGIDLSIRASWNREGSGLAKNCDNCGEGFPTSTKVKQCLRCQTPRGPHYVEKLLIKLSDTSGGAEDLAGLALQLSAAAWLKATRGSQFDVVYLDEVAGSLDPANRKAVGSHIAKMITGRFGFSQGFVVTHSPDVDEMFPGRILVTVKKDGTRTIEVV